MEPTQRGRPTKRMAKLKRLSSRHQQAQESLAAPANEEGAKAKKRGRGKRGRRVEQPSSKRAKAEEGVEETPVEKEIAKPKKSKADPKKPVDGQRVDEEKRKSKKEPTERKPSGAKNGLEASSAPRKAPKDPVPAVAADRKYVDLVKDVLTECVSSTCTHPSWEVPQFDKKTFEMTIYWSRKSCGVKIARCYVADKKKGNANSTTKAQVAYFSCPTLCTYSNIALAKEYVACLYMLYKPCMLPLHL